MTIKGKKLHRSQTDRMLAGVCGGLAEYISVDSTIVRLLFVIATLLGFSGVLVYIVMWIIVPSQE